MRKSAWCISISDVLPHFHIKMKVIASQEQAEKYSSTIGVV
jgi:hypothetical protein